MKKEKKMTNLQYTKKAAETPFLLMGVLKLFHGVMVSRTPDETTPPNSGVAGGGVGGRGVAALKC
jgi:hypothetical protein